MTANSNEDDRLKQEPDDGVGGGLKSTKAMVTPEPGLSSYLLQVLDQEAAPASSTTNADVDSSPTSSFCSELESGEQGIDAYAANSFRIDGQFNYVTTAPIASYCCKSDNFVDPCNNGCELDNLVSKEGTLLLQLNKNDSLAEALSCFFVPTILPGGPRTEQFDASFVKRHEGIILVLENDQVSTNQLNHMRVEGALASHVEKLIKPCVNSIWIHGSHGIAPLVSKLRKRFEKISIRFTWHASEHLYGDFIADLLSSSLLEFHRYEDCKMFLSSLDAMDVLIIWKPHSVKYDGKNIDVVVSTSSMVKALQIEKWESTLSLPKNISKVEQLKEKFGEKKILTAFLSERIDLVIRSVAHFLSTHPEWSRQFVLKVIADRGNEPGPNLIPQMMSANKICGIPEIDIDAWPHSERWALFSVTDCLIYTPICDGNAPYPEEYTVSRHKMGKSCMLLSDFVHSSIAEKADLYTHPWDFEMTAEVLLELLTLPGENQADIQITHYERLKSLKN